MFQNGYRRLGSRWPQAKVAARIGRPLEWTLDPDTYKAPFDLLAPVSDTPEDSKGCPAENDHSGSLDIFGHRAVSR